jgi:hypothetical protein
MKRSKMLDMIAKALEDINIENYYDEKGSGWCANLILMKIEENGMLPPVKDEQYDYFKRVKEKHGMALVLINKFQWEPEDV